MHENEQRTYDQFVGEDLDTVVGFEEVAGSDIEKLSDETVTADAGQATDVAALGRELERRVVAVENVPAGVFVLDEEATIEFVNEAGAALVDRTPSDLVGTTVSTLVSRGILDDAIVEWYGESVRRLLSSDADAETARYETRVRTDTGDVRVVEVTLSLRPYDEEYRGTVGVVRDVTERSRREAQLQGERDRLDEFVDVVSHDLRNPLGVARARLELARDEHDSEHLAAAARALDRMEDLLGDLLRLAREGDLTAEISDVPLGVAADQCWQTVETGDATLQVETEREIRADPGRLRQLLENAFRNAVEHGGEAVTITIGDLAEGFFVEDDGSGIHPDVRDRVFESGYSERDGGTGFGLAIVREIAVAHGWDVRAVDGREGGARFEFTDVDFAIGAEPSSSAPG